ncbi:MAG: tRNA (N(6)-L-threonylcarbamoyladenosine(37)-C(2))-methylthiotransferase MtaB [Lachnospiraceae bacterium]|nr:tRNA (N(6)-L-threonylcarbamoyladenosine(37)-C(2))-methylthiotransferase MtaB [Lachnospiraceae bacterium]MBQ2318042.1 tRNA (N(6)-L-threonylcarbamoyladenosine(37)-C(2))-methylthiotransferase MtaB [Lachnospiraceae bacterium]MBQ2467223.1 tRNA (N(6)-L-threonylcarbamoyladenosine(37)-C(2))-methylthiotransferase MtaB [Lachnospiraceae bacterium]MBQ2533744.1 tRNA (N(6)-L-threonylcarbamoyladenosine(37)-C(2))-methylthiotransferase MtaB [Lachnospiraceae bacterium]
MKRAALHNLGCKVNAYETEAMEQMLVDDGYVIVPFTEEADVYVINTCSVTNMADKKSRQMIHRARRQNPNAVIIAAGCYVQTGLQNASLDEHIADIIIGNNRKHELIPQLHQYLLEHRHITHVADINHLPENYEELYLATTSEHTRAFIKVQDGCNQFCSYCIIPYARGRVRSRKPENVLEEVERLAKNGFREIVLAGIHLSSYGVPGEYDLLDLIELLHGVPGIERIRLSSLEPQVVTEDFARRLSALEKICPHFHLSLQSGCDATLQRMNRKYTAEEYKQGVAMLRKYFDDPAITTDVIVGFPGETEEEFATCKNFLDDIHFYEMHVFKYSKREGTKAAVMDHQIPETVKSERSDVLIDMADRMSEEYRKRYLNRKVEVLFEEQEELNGVTYWMGFTKEYIRVALQTDENLANTIVTGRLGQMLTSEVLLLERD